MNGSSEKCVLRKALFVINFMFIMGLCMSFSSKDVSASKKAASKVTGSLKNGVYTVSGKGKMTDSAKPTASQKKKIKKIVIKKGVTSLPEMAFSNCTKASTVSIASTVREIGMQAFAGTSIKRITIPKTVKEIGWGILRQCNLLETITLPGKFTVQKPSNDRILEPFVVGKKALKKVKFSTPLDPELVRMVGDCENFEVSSDDTKFKSEDGLIYTIDGRTLVRIPYARKEAVIAEGCEKVAVGSYSYSASGNYEADIYNGCGALQSIVFPASVNEVTDKVYSDHVSSYISSNENGFKVQLNTVKLNEDSIRTLWYSYTGNNFRKSLADELAKVGSASYTDGMVILKDGYLCGYIGSKDKNEVIVSDSVKVIGKYAFSSSGFDYKLKSVVLGKNVEEVGDYAFYLNKEIKVYVKSKNIKMSGKAFDACDTYELIFE